MAQVQAAAPPVVVVQPQETVLTRNRGCADLFLIMIVIGVLGFAGCFVCAGSHH